MALLPHIEHGGYRSLAIGSAASLAVALGAAEDDSARIGLYADDTAGSEVLGAVVGGVTGLTLTRSGSEVHGNLAGDLTVQGDLTVLGDATRIDTASVTVEDPLIQLASGNPSDLLDVGLYGLYDDGDEKYAGLFRDATDGKWRLFEELEDEPATTVDTGGTGYAVATLVANLEADTIGEITAAAGVTIDGVLLKDNGITASGASTFAGATIADLGTVTTAEINGGTLDDVVIGGSSAAAASFTTLGSSGLASLASLDVAGTAQIDGATTVGDASAAATLTINAGSAAANDATLVLSTDALAWQIRHDESAGNRLKIERDGTAIVDVLSTSMAVYGSGGIQIAPASGDSFFRLNATGGGGKEWRWTSVASTGDFVLRNFTDALTSITVSGSDGSVNIPVQLDITDTTAATGASDGSLINAGGFQNDGDAYIDGDLFIGAGSDITLKNNTAINIEDSGGTSRELIKVNGSDIGIIGGDSGYSSFQLRAPSSTTFSFFVGGTRIARVVNTGLATDSGYSIDSGDVFKVSGTQVVTNRQTGWGAPTGTATRTTFATSTVTLSELAERVHALIDDLTTHGLIGS